MDQRAIAAVKRIVADAGPAGEGYAAAARLEAVTLGATTETRARVARLVAGDAPWSGVAEPT
jgi:hypothetical protein